MPLLPVPPPVRPAHVPDSLAPPGRAAAATLQARLAQLAIGTQVQGEVLRRQADGSTLVRIADTAVRMKIPPGFVPGDLLPMQLLSRTPRFTFLLGNARISVLPDAAAGTPAAAPGAETASAAPQLSAGARLIQAALRHSAGAALLSSTSAVVDSADAAPEQLARGLQTQLARSGLFFEAHAARWVQGRFPLSELRQEPQAQVANSGAAQAEPEAARLELVSAQLAVLEQKKLQWQGEVWPGQPMQWEVGEDEEERREEGGGREPQPVWQSRLRLSLPRLGGIEASLKLVGARLQVCIEAGEDGTAKLLQASAGEFVEAMRDAGTVVEHLAIAHAGERHEPR